MAPVLCCRNLLGWIAVVLPDSRFKNLHLKPAGSGELYMYVAYD